MIRVRRSDHRPPDAAALGPMATALGLLFVAAASTGLPGQTAGPPPAPAPRESPGEAPGRREVELLRRASAAEAAGDLPAARSLLERILDERAASVPALLALERVLRVDGRLEALAPRVEAAVDAEPASALLNELRIRTYAALDRADALMAAERAWMDAAPGTETAYREIARLESGRGAYDRARAVLEEGRRRLGRPNALALEVGDLYVDMKEPGLAIAEWDRAIDRDGGGLSQVRRRLQSLPDGGASLMRPLVERLAGDSATRPRLLAAVRLAVDAGMEEEARRLAEGLLTDMSPAERSTFLSGLARQSDAANRSGVAYWAYRALLEVEESRDRRARRGADAAAAGRMLALRRRVVELGLAVGDTAGAVGSRGAGEQTAEADPEAARVAAAAHVQLLAGDAPDRALGALKTFRSLYPDAPETDAAAASVAEALRRAGRALDAATVLRGVRGPRSSLIRARMSLTDGELDAARAALMNAAAGLRGAEATEALALAGLLNRLSPEAGRRLARALDRRDAGHPGDAVDMLSDTAASLPDGDRAALLDYAASVAEAAGLQDDVRRTRGSLIARYPRSLEAPRSLLALARERAASAGGAAEARELLERLILEYPRSPLAPQARHALEELGRDATGGSTKE